MEKIMMYCKKYYFLAKLDAKYDIQLQQIVYDAIHFTKQKLSLKLSKGQQITHF